MYLGTQVLDAVTPPLHPSPQGRLPNASGQGRFQREKDVTL